jgi:hypothetical protein
MNSDKQRRKSATKKPERKQKAVPFDRKDPRQLQLMLTPGDEFETTRRGEKK